LSRSRTAGAGALASAFGLLVLDFCLLTRHSGFAPGHLKMTNGRSALV
jgi:hypothetical protein